MGTVLNYSIMSLVILNGILLAILIHQGYSSFGYGQYDVEKKILFFGCGDYGKLFHCDPLSNRFTSDTTKGNETEIYPVTRNDPTYVDGRFGKALEMHDTYREFVEIADKPDYNSHQLSVSFWVKGMTNPDSKYGHIISHVNKKGNAGWFFDITSPKSDNSGNALVRFVASNSSGNIISSDDISVSNSTFVNIVGTVNGSIIKVYRDGVFVQKLEGNYSSDPGLPIHIGSAAYCTSCERMAGFIDDMRLYNRTITENEVRQLFNANTSDVVLNGLIGYWKLDDNLNDESGANNHGRMFTPLGSMAFSPDGRMFFTEKNTGRIMIMSDDHVIEKPFAVIPDIYVNWEQGLLGLTVDPDFVENHYVYAYYTTTKYEQPINRVVRFTAVNNTAIEMIVLLDDIPASKGYHSGGALAFGPDDKLYITVGDATEGNSAQSTSVLNGKVLRINKDGTIPSDNPFPNSPVFTLGHRNMYGIAFDEKSGIGIVTENGAYHYDEINLIQKGGNYGYPTFQPPNIAPELSTTSVKPIRSYWDSIAPTQALYYTGDKYNSLKESFLFGTYTGDIYSVRIDNQSKQIRSENHINLEHYPFEPVIGIAQSPNGVIYSGAFHINRLVSVDVNNKVQEFQPLEIDAYSDVDVKNIKLSDESMVIDLYRNTTDKLSRNITISIPPSIIKGTLAINVVQTGMNGSQDERPVNFVLDDAEEKRVHMQLPEGKNLQLRIYGSPTSVSRAPNIEVSQNLYDSFDGNPYTLHESQVSPNKLWHNVFDGGGLSGVKKDRNGNGVLFMYSNTSSSPSESYSGLVVTTKSFSDFEMSLEVKTEKQLRQNTPANPWEVAWLFFRYTDDQHNYWLTLKPSGIELGRKGCLMCPSVQEPTYLYTDNSPKSSLDTWSKLYIKMIKDRITIRVNDAEVLDYVDTGMSDQLRSGVIGLYTNDAAVTFDNIYIKSLDTRN